MAFKMKMKEYGQGKSPIQMKGDSPAKFLGGKLAAKLDSKLPGKAGKIAGKLLNPLGAIKDRIQAKRGGGADPAAMAGDVAAMQAQQAAAAGAAPGATDPAAAADPTATAATAAPVDPNAAVDPTAAPMAKKRKYSK